jgi:hypothetical protein
MIDFQGLPPASATTLAKPGWYWRRWIKFIETMKYSVLLIRTLAPYLLGKSCVRYSARVLPWRL